MNLVKSITINKILGCIQVTLSDDTIMQFSAHYSGYEDCVNLLLSVNGNKKTVMESFVGYTDEASKFSDELERIKTNG